MVLITMYLDLFSLSSSASQLGSITSSDAVTVTEPDYPTFTCTLGAGGRKEEGNSDFSILIRIKNSSQFYFKFVRTVIACED